MDELVGNLQTYKANYHKKKKYKGLMLNIETVNIDINIDFEINYVVVSSFVKHYKKYILK